MKNSILLFYSFLAIGTVQVLGQTSADPRLCWYEPATASQDEEITIYFNAARGNCALKGFDGDVYITSGIVTRDNDDLSGLSHMIGPDGTTVSSQYTMKRSATDPDIYSITITPSRYYVASDDEIKMIGMTFSSADGLKNATDADGSIIYLPFKNNVGLMWYRRESALPTDEITVYFDATLGNAALKDFTGDVYAHSGVLTSESSSTSDWKHAPTWCDNSQKYLFSRSTVDPNIYTCVMTPSTFFNLNENEVITSLAFVMRNADGSKCGRDLVSGNECDIIVPFVNKGTSVTNNTLGKYISYTDDGTSVIVNAEKGTMILTAYNDYVIKVFTQPNGDTEGERRSITVCAEADGYFSVSEHDDCLVITTSATRVELDKSNCSLSFYDQDGRLRLSEDGGLDNSGTTRKVTFDAMGDVAFYGGGYNGQRVNHDGQTLTMNNTQTGGWESSWQAPHNICVPFVVSTSGYGLLFDDHYRNARLTPSSSGTTYESGSLNPIAYYYVGGDGSMESVMENYTFLTGRQELPPYWALGYMTSRYGYHSRSEAESVVDAVKDASLPLDGIVMDLYWQGEENSGMGTLDWYSSNWPDASGMMADFNSRGVKTILITEPFFTSASANYGTLSSKGYFADSDVSGMEWLGSEKVGLIDTSNPAAMDWMWSFYKARTEEGVGGWWLDLGEPERHDDDSSHQGGSVAQIHNEFGNLWTERVYRGMKEDFPDRRPFLMPRSGTSGMQRYSVFPWTGDIRRSWGGLEAQIPALVSASMSGIGYMGSDVGGFSVSGSTTDSELYLRWVEFAVFSPMMRTHSTYLPEPYNDCYSSVLDDVRRFLNMRYSYLPYTYTLAFENATKGTPLARPVNFYDPTSRALRNCIDEYLWGRDILVAPVVASSTSRSITFPAGKWVDLNDMTKTYNGGTTVQYQAPLSVLPHFARKGSIIARYSQSSYTNTSEIDQSAVTLTYLMSDNDNEAVSASIFDDDRNSPESIENGEYLLTNIEAIRTSETNTISFGYDGNGYAGMPEERLFTIVVPGYSDPVDHVGISGRDEAFVNAGSETAFDNADDAVYYLSSDNTLYLKSRLALGSPTVIEISSSDMDGVGAVTDARDAISVEYASENGTFYYSIPLGYSGATITVYAVDGSQVASLRSLVADGTINQAVPDRALPRGIYIAELRAVAADGTPVSRNLKLLAR